MGIGVNEVGYSDDQETIINTVNELRKKYTYIFTTGGIGPTHDDITSESISKVFNIEYNFHPEAFKILENYYKPGEFTEGRQKMAQDANNIKIIKSIKWCTWILYGNVFCLPGFLR